MKLRIAWVLILSAAGFSTPAFAGPWDSVEPKEVKEVTVEKTVETAVEVIDAPRPVLADAPDPVKVQDPPVTPKSFAAKTVDPKTAAPKAAAAAPKTAAPAPAAPPAEDPAARALKGIENQKAWIATLEKQLDGEKAKLAQMEAGAGKTGKKK